MNQYINERYTLYIVHHKKLQDLILSDCNVYMASVAPRSMAYARDLSLCGIVDSNPADVMEIRLLYMSRVVS